MYKLLLAGNNQSVIEKFFVEGSGKFELMTTSMRSTDITNHIRYFQPDMILYCLGNEARDVFSRILSARGKWYGLPFGLIMSRENCEEWKESSNISPDLLFQLPIEIHTAFIKISEFLDKRNPESLIDCFKEHTAPVQEEPAEKRPHILVVDDDILMLKTIKGHLDETYDVATAKSGKMALKFLESKTTDLILLDYEMPEESGVDVLKKIRNNPKTKDIPVIFLTGITEQNKIKKAISMKPQGYMLKPVEHDKLIKEIEKTLKKYGK